MDGQTILEVVKKLNGDITPVGSKHIDKQIEINLKQLIFITDELVHEISKIRRLKDRQEASIRKSVILANNFIGELNQFD